jgi:hypothetical protein
MPVLWRKLDPWPCLLSAVLLFVLCLAVLSPQKGQLPDKRIQFKKENVFSAKVFFLCRLRWNSCSFFCQGREERSLNSRVIKWLVLLFSILIGLLVTSHYTAFFSFDIILRSLSVTLRDSVWRTYVLRWPEGQADVSYLKIKYHLLDVMIFAYHSGFKRGVGWPYAEMNIQENIHFWWINEYIWKSAYTLLHAEGSKLSVFKGRLRQKSEKFWVSKNERFVVQWFCAKLKGLTENKIRSFSQFVWKNESDIECQYFHQKKLQTLFSERQLCL